MREIKFRGKKIYNDEWVYGDLWNFSDNSTMIIQHFKGSEVISETVGQYTGLKDKNSIEIFEGDIVEIVYCNLTAENMTVTWNFKKAKFEFIDSEKTGWTIIDTDMKVIGNIHDNKELLEV